jgi:tetratricopeptide (TPR) repeat protein
MYRRAAVYASKMIAGVGSLQLGAAAVALTDKQLGKKPEWYKNSVLSLEHSLKTLSKYSYIESEEVLNHAEESLQRFVDLNDPEILWRLARTFAEKAELIKCPKKKSELLHQAVHLAEKAVVSKASSAQAHKWLAISNERLIAVDKKASKNASLPEKIFNHLKRATELDSNDPFTWHLLGVAQYKKKEYKDAIASFQKAESVKPNFSASNLFYLGDSQRLTGSKAEATETLKKAFNTPSKNKFDGKAKSEAKRILTTKLKQKPEDFEINEDF